MAKTIRNAAVIVAAVAVVMLPLATPAFAGDVTIVPAQAEMRVRSADPALNAAIRQGINRSATFRQMVETINASDAFVYIRSGKCRHNEHACFTSVSVAGAHRVMWVTVDTVKAGEDVMGSIGHELRHTIEAISDPTVMSFATLYFFYSSNGIHTMSGSVETTAATDAGNAVRHDLRSGGR